MGDAGRIGARGALMKTLRTIAPLAALALSLCSVTGATMAEFIRCIAPQGQGPVCKLDAGVYQLNSELVIGRSNITVEGTVVNSRRDTTLQRAPGFTGTLLSDFIGTENPPSLRSVTIRDLTFDGNRAQQSGQPSSYGQEVYILRTKSLLVTNSDFINSPRISLVLREFASGVVISNCYFGNPALWGIFSTPPDGVLETTPNDYLRCDTLHYTQNIVIAGSQFENAGANGIILQASDVLILNNVLAGNHKDAPFNFPGGQIDLSICADNVAVLRNTIKDGPIAPNGDAAYGLEAHGTNLTIVDNVITNNAGAGIGLYGVQNAFIANWDVSTGVINNNKIGSRPGIDVNNSVGQRSTDSIIIDHTNAIDGHTYGILITNQVPTVPIDHIMLTNNCLKGNLRGGLLLSGLGFSVVNENNLTSGCGPN